MSYVMNNFMPIKQTISMKQTKFLKRHKTTKVNAEKQIISKGLYLSKILNLQFKTFHKKIEKQK